MTGLLYLYFLLASSRRILGLLDPEDEGNMSPEPSVTIYHSTRPNIAESLNPQQHRYENLRSRQIHHYLLLTSHVIHGKTLKSSVCG